MEDHHDEYDLSGPPPAVMAPRPTLLWQVRTLLAEVQTLGAKIIDDVQLRGLVRAQARQLLAEVDGMITTTGGRPSINLSDMDRVQQIRDTLSRMLDPAPAAEPPAQVLAAGAVATIPDGVAPPRPGPGPAEQVTEQQLVLMLVRAIQAERAHLPVITSRWPWQDRAARRQVQAWMRAWRLSTRPVDKRRVQRAWDRYVALMSPAPAPTLGSGSVPANTQLHTEG